MSYLMLTRVAADPHIILRASACAAAEGIPDQQFWVQAHMWELSAQDGWGDAYAKSDSEEPGADETAITDQMILTAVRAIRTAETPPAE